MESIEVVEGRRVVIETVQPGIDGGCFPIKWIPGGPVIAGADVSADGHGSPDCTVLYRGEFHTGDPRLYVDTIEGWIDALGVVVFRKIPPGGNA